jgi:enamine deaminase RidA (YjgF/YER057c/UK114 family)
MHRKVLAAGLALALIGAASAHAENVHVGDAKSPIATSVTVPAGSDMIYVSGLTASVADPSAPAGTKASYGDTKTQTISVIGKLKAALEAQGFTLGDVVMMRVYLAGDPDMGGKMDFPGMMAGYLQFFGTPDQPNKPSRVTTQVASLVGPGGLVEIEVQAAKKHVMKKAK